MLTNRSIPRCTVIPELAYPDLGEAIDRLWRQLLRAAYGEFVDAFRRAAERLKSGDRSVQFPQGSFPPPLPFVGG